MDTVDRLPQTGGRGVYLKQRLQDKLVEHKQYINDSARICRKSVIGAGASRTEAILAVHDSG